MGSDFSPQMLPQFQALIIIKQLQQMCQQSQGDIIDVLHATQSNSREFTSTLELPHYSVTHENKLSVQIEKIENESEIPQIKNYLACVTEGRIVKVTEIRYKDKVVRISDFFSYFPNSMEKNEVSELKTAEEGAANRPHLNTGRRQKQTCVINHRQGKKVRNTKNAVKNIFKIFQSWIEEKMPSQLNLGEALKAQLRNNKEKFNNQLIIEMFHDANIRKAFIAFSQVDGQQLIGESRIDDKKSHVQILSNYRSICLNEDSMVKIEEESQ